MIRKDPISLYESLREAVSRTADTFFKAGTMKRSSSGFRRSVLFNLLVALGILSRIFHDNFTGSSAPRQAYLDPGTGSMIISAVIGVFATLVLGFKTAGYRIAGLFKGKPKKADEKNDGKPQKE